MQKQDKQLADIVLTTMPMTNAQSPQRIEEISQVLASLPTMLNFKSRAQPSRLNTVVDTTNSATTAGTTSPAGAMMVVRIRLHSAGDAGADKVKKFVQGR
jgi:hypothetical protein